MVHVQLSGSQNVQLESKIMPQGNVFTGSDQLDQAAQYPSTRVIS